MGFCSRGPVEGGARPVTSPLRPVARIRATVNLRLDPIRRVPLHCPPQGAVHHPRSPRNICFEMHCSAACLHHYQPLFFISPLQQLSSFFSLPVFSPSVPEDGSRSVMSAQKAASHPEANLIQVRVSVKHVSVCGRCLGTFVRFNGTKDCARIVPSFRL